MLWILSDSGGEIKFRRRCRSEKQGAEVLLTQHPLQFPECKEWNESAKYDETAAEEIIDAYLAQCCCHFFLWISSLISSSTT